ncbi:MAG: NADPH-dependent F420 reductase [Mycobacteriales bacterium]
MTANPELGTRRVQSLGILGGTGEQGRGLAKRLSRAGHDVILGSRDAARAATAAAELQPSRGRLPITGGSNADAASADLVIVAVPYDGHRDLLASLVGELAGKIVVDCVNPMTFGPAGPRMIAVPEGSAAEEAAAVLPKSTLVSAFHDVSAKKLLGSAASVPTDVLVCGDDRQANEVVCRLAAEIRGMRGIEVGPLALSGVLESLTLVLIGINKRYKTRSGVRVTGV